jgi:GDP-4-dehydro-6-deoxy-D-mannose reductase
MNIAIFRPFPHIGPGQKLGFFVPDMVSQIVELENNPENSELMVGNLDAIRDYLDVRDVVEAYALAIEKDFNPGDAFNICSGKGIKIANILDKLINLSSRDINIKKDPDRLRPSEVPVLVGDNSKLIEKFGWKPRFELNQTLNEILEYWRSQV